MSHLPSIKSPTDDTPTRWLSNDDGGSLSRKPSEDAVEQARAEEQVASPVDEQAHYLPDMSLIVDDDTFHSAPTQPEDEPDASAPAPSRSIEYEEPTEEDLLPPSDFKPFFTLVEDPETGEHYHPTVHYMFADDDPEILTSAALEAIDRQGESVEEGRAPSGEVEERYVLLDMAAGGKTASSISSLSGDWQGLKVEILPAPSWGEESNGKDRGLMLKISGQEGSDLDISKGKRGFKDGKRGLDELVKLFGARLDRLDEVLGRTAENDDDRNEEYDDMNQ